MEIMNIKPKYLKLIKSGKKKIEFRSWLSTDDEYFLMKNIKTKKVEAVIKVYEVIDMKDFPEEEKESILDDNYVSQSFRKSYDCRYAYLIKEVYNVH